MEHQLFAVPHDPAAVQAARGVDPGTLVRVRKSKSLNPTGATLTVAAWAQPESPSGVILAHGGSVLGYALYIRQNKACFSVCDTSHRAEVLSARPLPTGWVHLAGVLTADAGLALYVNGELQGQGKAPALLSGDPANELQIGGYEASPVGDYQGGLPFKGSIDDVRVYHGQLDAPAIGRLAHGEELGDAEDAQRVLHFSFDEGEALDLSGHGNDGAVVGAATGDGRLGQALHFSGMMPGAPRDTSVDYAWAYPSPILVRGMLVAGEHLFVAGPEDRLDEPAALNHTDDEDVQVSLRAQSQAMAGELGGKLLVIACGDGAQQAAIPLETIPVWDGLAAAAGRLYMAGVDGTVRCFEGR